MRKLVTFLMTLLVGSSVSYVSAESGQVMFEAGYRRDNINWRFEAPSCDPFFETNTRFKDLDIFQIGLSGRTHIGCNWYGRASVSGGWILDGDIEDSTSLFASFSGLDISGLSGVEFSNDDENIVDGRFVVDLDIAVGYPFYFCDCTVAIAPVVGYAFNEQNVRIEDDEVFRFSDSGSGVFPFPTSGSECCDSKYVSRWYGPFVGVDFEYRACNCLSVYAALEYHWVNFRGRRHSHRGFSLNDNFHRTARDGDGWAFKGGIDYELCDCWSVGLSTTWKDFSVSRRHHGCADDFSAFSGFESGSGSERHRFRTKHRWHSWSVSASIGKMF